MILRVRAVAEAELTAAATRYENQLPGRGSRFVAAVDRTLARVRERPTRFRS